MARQLGEGIRATTAQGSPALSLPAAVTTALAQVGVTRIDELGVEEPLIQKSGAERLIVELAGIDDPQAYIAACRERGIEAIHGECILMFAEPAGFVHRLHRWLRGVTGKLPEEA